MKTLPGTYNNIVGAKYESTKDLSVVEVAKLIRAEIKALVKSRKLPAGKYSVKSSGNSLSIRVTELAFRVIDVNAYRWNGNFAEYDHSRENPHGRFTAEASRVRALLESIGDAYNYDKGEPMSDYYNMRFYLSVDVESASGEWAALESELRTASEVA